MLQYFAIVVLCVLSVITYGVLHDQVTARVCIEYFTIGHPPIFTVPVTSPTIVGIAWGVVASWWVGAGLGVTLAFAARFGKRPPRSATSLIKPIAILLAITACFGLCFGAIGWWAASSGWVVLLEPLASRVPSEKHVAFLADLWAHSSSYTFGALGGMVLIARTWSSRGKNSTEYTKTTLQPAP